MSRIYTVVIAYDQTIADHVQNMLRALGYKATVLISPGSDAIAALGQQNIALAMLCIDMHHQDNAVMLAEQLWQQYLIPVIVIVPFVENKLLEQITKAGVFGYICKPYDIDILKAAVSLAVAKAQVETKYRRSEQELTKYSSIVDNADIAMYIIAHDSFEYVNPAFEQLTGFSLMELRDKNISFDYFIDPEDKALIQAIHTAREKSTGSAPRFEIKIVTGFKENKIVESMMMNITMGKEIKIMGIMRDITERKRMEEITRLSEQYYKGMFDNADEAILVFSPENEIVIDVNPSACNLYGFTREEFEGLSLEHISKDVSQGKMQIEETLRKGTYHNFETVQYRKDGSELYLEIHASALTINNRKIILSINHNISEQKKFEQELKLNLTRVGHSLEGMIKTISIISEKRDPHTAGHHKRVANFSYAIAKKLGLSDEQAEGVKTAAYIHDLGKLNIPADILTKPETLNEYEYNMIKTHPRAAYDILKNIDFPWSIAEIVYQHHEKINGSGYPLGLRGEQIMLESKILMVANVVESIISPRAYRSALTLQKAIEELSLHRNEFYDAGVVDAAIFLLLNENYSLNAL
jgi:PAS domain S-box-containing protein/putative nucleotidyltransferase with HDIG domain